MSTANFSPLTVKEQAWITEQLEAARHFVAAFAPEHSENPTSLEALDTAFAQWLVQSSGDNTEINGAINAVGTQFGQLLVDQAGFQWTIATNKDGTELAIRALPGTADVLVYPANFVAKRWERRETNFLVDGFQAIRAQVERFAADWKRKKPWWQFW